MNRAMTVEFHGTEIVCVQLEGTVFVVLKPVVEAIGLAWNGQLERIKRDAVLREGMRMVRIPFLRGGNQDAVALRLDRLHGWLFTVDSGRVREALRERVQLFQRECYDVLYAHFSGEREKLMRETNECESLSLRMVTETRHIWGERAAAELWEKRKLPTVAAMADAFRQRDLFGGWDRAA
jgi:hypothetical protein